MPELSIIIVTWNSRSDIERCLGSIAESGTVTPVEIIVVDNASRDETAAFVRKGFSGVELLVNETNTGFAAGNNRGLDAARGQFLLLLNPDTYVHAGAFDTLVTFMKEHPQVWACGPPVFNADGSPQRTGVRFPGLWNMLVESLFLDRVFPRTRVFGGHKELYREPGLPRKVDYVQGSCLLVRRKAMEQVGMLDEGFFMYFEETDWCRRMKEAGGEVLYVPGPGIVHYGGGTTGHYDERRLMSYHRSILRFYRKHHAAPAGVVLRLVLVFRSIIRIAVWSGYGLTHVSQRPAAVSALRGYMRVLLLLAGLRSER
jgi:N-acetylglucosaminyl-diphospho-decaprenol L-rhamnosyltransferase